VGCSARAGPGPACRGVHDVGTRRLTRARSPGVGAPPRAFGARRACSNADHVVTWTIRNSDSGHIMTITSAVANVGATTYPVTGLQRDRGQERVDHRDDDRARKRQRHHHAHRFRPHGTTEPTQPARRLSTLMDSAAPLPLRRPVIRRLPRARRRPTTTKPTTTSTMTSTTTVPPNDEHIEFDDVEFHEHVVLDHVEFPDHVVVDDHISTSIGGVTTSSSSPTSSSTNLDVDRAGGLHHVELDDVDCSRSARPRRSFRSARRRNRWRRPRALPAHGFERVGRGRVRTELSRRRRSAGNAEAQPGEALTARGRPEGAASEAALCTDSLQPGVSSGPAMSDGKQRLRVLFVENYDSSTYNLFDYLAACDGDVQVVLNDEPSFSRGPRQVARRFGRCGNQDAGETADACFVTPHQAG